MIRDGRARLVEYNVRFGDPECQVLMMRLGAQALDLILACAEGRLTETAVTWAEDHALTVVLAARGYPGPHERGTEISWTPCLDSSQMVFHAGTALEGWRAGRDGACWPRQARRGATWPRRMPAPMPWPMPSTGRAGSTAATSAGGRRDGGAVGMGILENGESRARLWPDELRGRAIFGLFKRLGRRL